MSSFLKRTPKEPKKRVRLRLQAIDLWSATKLGFLLSIAIGIVNVVAVFSIWQVLNEIGLFASIDELLGSVFGAVTPINVTQDFALEQVMSTTATLSLLNIILTTALTVIWAGIFNVVSKLIGGVGLTFTNN